MKIEKTFLLILLIIPSLVKAQDNNAESLGFKKDHRRFNSLFNTIGVTIGVGATSYKLAELNQKLDQLKAPLLSDQAGIREIKLSAGSDFLMGSIFFALADLKQIHQPSSFPLSNKKFNYVEVIGMYYGFELSKPLLNTKTIQINFPTLGGCLSFYQMRLDSLNTLAGGISANNLASYPSKLIVLSNKENQNVRFGADFFYTPKLSTLWDIKVGITTGYNLPLRNSEWYMLLNNTVVPDMPKFKGNFFLFFNFGTSLKFEKLKNKTAAEAAKL